MNEKDLQEPREEPIPEETEVIQGQEDFFNAYGQPQRNQNEHTHAHKPVSAKKEQSEKNNKSNRGTEVIQFYEECI